MAGDIVKQLRDTRYPGQLEMRREAADEIERLRATLELIAGSATDKLQAMHAKAALDNIGPAMAPAERGGQS